MDNIDMNRYTEFTEQMEKLIRQIIENNGIKYQQITNRTKTKESIDKKIKRKGYTDIKQLTDISGIRVIVYLMDDIEKVAKIIEDEFVIDITNSIDKRFSETFGYSSLHYICSLAEDRLSLPEYNQYYNMRFEIQIRTVLQHAWVEIEHDLGYKNKNYISMEDHRTFKRISALLEEADEAFIDLKKNQTSKEIADKISVDSLDNYIKVSTIVQNLDKKIVEILKQNGKNISIKYERNFFHYPQKNVYYGLFVDSNIENFEYVNICSISILDHLLASYQEEVVEISSYIEEIDKRIWGANRKTYLPKGYCIGCLIILLLFKSSNLRIKQLENIKGYFLLRVSNFEFNKTDYIKEMEDCAKKCYLIYYELKNKRHHLVEYIGKDI